MGTSDVTDERQARIEADTAMVKGHARRSAYAQGISRAEYDSNNRMRASWEARAVAALTDKGIDLHRVVIFAYGAS